MEYPVFIPIAVTVLEKQNEWLNEQSALRALSKSVLLREAIELLKEKYERKDKEK